MVDLTEWAFDTLLALNVLYMYVYWRAMFRVGDEIHEWLMQERKDALEQIPTNLRKFNGHVIAQYVNREKILSHPEFDRRCTALKKTYRHQLIGVLLFVLVLTWMAFSS